MFYKIFIQVMPMTLQALQAFFPEPVAKVTLNQLFNLEFQSAAPPAGFDATAASGVRVQWSYKTHTVRCYS